MKLRSCAWALRTKPLRIGTSAGLSSNRFDASSGQRAGRIPSSTWLNRSSAPSDSRARRSVLLTGKLAKITDQEAGVSVAPRGIVAKLRPIADTGPLRRIFFMRAVRAMFRGKGLAAQHSQMNEGRTHRRAKRGGNLDLPNPVRAGDLCRRDNLRLCRRRC